MGAKGDVTPIIDPGILGKIKFAASRRRVAGSHDLRELAVAIDHEDTRSQVLWQGHARRDLHNAREDNISRVIQRGRMPAESNFRNPVTR